MSVRNIGRGVSREYADISGTRGMFFEFLVFANARSSDVLEVCVHHVIRPNQSGARSVSQPDRAGKPSSKLIAT